MSRSEKVSGETVLVSLQPTPATVRCPASRSRNVIRKGVKQRLIRGTPVGSTQVWFDVAVPRVACRCCGVIRQVRIPCAEEKRRHTRQFERDVQERTQITTTRHTADHWNLSRDTIRDFESRDLSPK